MKTILRIWVPALLFVSTGCQSARPVASTAPPATSVASSTTDLESLYWAQKDSSRTHFTPADVHFMTGMIVHHAQALVMSVLAPSHGAGPEVSTLTLRILNSQRAEIKTMQNWLRDRGQVVPEIHIDGLNLTVTGVDKHMMHMPGMLSQDQLVELDAARGPDFDRLFLKYMIQHHSGAITMVDDLFSTDGAGQDELAFKLASDINVDQKTEIARMNRLLDRLSGTSEGN